MFGTPVDRGIGSAYHNQAAFGIVRWAGHRQTTAALLARALADVRDDFAMTPPPSVMIQAEYFVVMDQLNRFAETAENYRESADIWRSIGIEYPNDVELFLNNEPELTKRLLRHQAANLLKFIDEPDGHHPALLGCPLAYFDQLPAATDHYAEPAAFQAAVDRSPLAQILLIDQGDVDGFLSREAARQRILETVLAAELYRREQGSFPDSLEVLVAEGPAARHSGRPDEPVAGAGPV